MKFKTNKLAGAILASLGGGLIAASTAEAVSVNADGLGEVLIYPYFTVRDNGRGVFNTYLSVVNTTDMVKAVKVRFLEGKNSTEVLDFNLYLSPFDVWTTVIRPTANGAEIRTVDRSCTVPPIPAGGVEFVNRAYEGDPALDDSLDRTREGYIELIEMGELNPIAFPGVNAVHVPPGGTPLDCTVIQQLDGNGTMGAFVTEPTGGLMGTGTLINVNQGVDYGYNPTALASFHDVPGLNIWFEAGSILPNLGNVEPKESHVVIGNTVFNDTWTSANPADLFVDEDPVTAVLMYNTVLNEYILDAGTLSGTDWVITMPTKYAYVNGAAPVRPFTSLFDSPLGACEEIWTAIWDREEDTEIPELDFSPPREFRDEICWEVNVITFDSSNLLGSSLVNPDVLTTFENGWFRIDFNNALAAGFPQHFMVSAPGQGQPGGPNFGRSIYLGLPVVGFMVQDFINGVLVVEGERVLSSYGGLFPHKGIRVIESFEGNPLTGN